MPINHEAIINSSPALKRSRFEIEFIRQYYHPDLDRPKLTFNDLAEEWQYRLIIEPFFSDAILTYIEMPRDWDKTGLHSACAVAECYCSPRRRIRSYAADKDQAAIIMDAIRNRIIGATADHGGNPMGIDGIIPQAFRVDFGNGSELIIEAADAAGSFGKGQDKALLDELHCWHLSAHEALYNAIVTKGRTKTRITTNPGSSKEGLCWNCRETVRKRAEKGDKSVFFYTGAEDPFKPSWLKEATVRRNSVVPAGVFNRLHLCRWGAGGDLFTEDHISTTADPAMEYVSAYTGTGAVGAVDLGLSRDWTAFVVLAPISGHVRVIHKKVWKGTKKQNVRIDDVEEYVKWGAGTFSLTKVVIERWQMTSTIQKFENELACEVVDFNPTASSVVELSENFFQFVDRGILRFPASDNDLSDELRGLEAEEVKGRGKSAKEGFKIVYKRRSGGKGHGDVTRAIAMAALYCRSDVTRPFDEVLGGVAMSDGNDEGNRRGHDGQSTGTMWDGSTVESLDDGDIESIMRGGW